MNVAVSNILQQCSREQTVVVGTGLPHDGSDGITADFQQSSTQFDRLTVSPRHSPNRNGEIGMDENDRKALIVLTMPSFNKGTCQFWTTHSHNPVERSRNALSNVISALLEFADRATPL